MPSTARCQSSTTAARSPANGTTTPARFAMRSVRVMPWRIPPIALKLLPFGAGVGAVSCGLVIKRDASAAVERVLARRREREEPVQPGDADRGGDRLRADDDHELAA